MADLNERLRIRERRKKRIKSVKYLFRQLTLRSLALLVAVAMVLSSTKMPAAYAYFTATAEQEQPFTFTIIGGCRGQAMFLDQHLIDVANEVSPRIARAAVPAGNNAYQPVAMNPVVTAVITLEDGFNPNEVDLSTVEIHFEDHSTSALSGVVRDGDLVVEFDRAELIAWFEGREQSLDEVTFEITGMGGTDGVHEFMFTALATIHLTGTYEIVAVRIDGPNALLIPEGGKSATETYKLVKQDGLRTDAVWSISEPLNGVAVNAQTGDVSLDSTAVPGFFTLRAEFTRPDGTHFTEKTVEMVADPNLTISGPSLITIGDLPQQYRVETEGNVALENITWRITGPVGGIAVDHNGLVTVSDSASPGEFTLAVTAEFKSILLNAETTVVVEEPVDLGTQSVIPEEPAVPDADLPETALFIRGEDLILIPSENETVEVSYIALDRDGNPVPDVSWSMTGHSEGVEFDAALRMVTVTSKAAEGVVTLEAIAERVVESEIGDESEAATTITLSGKKTITLARSAPTSVNVTGPEIITIPVADPENDAGVEESFIYEVEVLDQKGNVLDEQEVTWSLAEELPGVSINDAGVLSVTSDAVAGTITIIVTSAATGEIIGTLEIQLVGETTGVPGAGGGGGGVNDPPNREEDADDEGIVGGEGGSGDGPSEDPGEEPDESGDESDESGKEPGDEPDESGDESGESGKEPGDESDESGDESGESGKEPGDESDDEGIVGGEGGSGDGSSKDPGEEPDESGDESGDERGDGGNDDVTREPEDDGDDDDSGSGPYDSNDDGGTGDLGGTGVDSGGDSSGSDNGGSDSGSAGDAD